MQGALPPHPTPLVFTNIKHAYTATVKHSYLAYLGGPEGAIAFPRDPFCEYAIQDTKSPHPAPLVFSNIKYICEITVDTRNLSIMDAPEVHSLFRGPLFANAQCEADRGRIRCC